MSDNKRMRIFKLLAAMLIVTALPLSAGGSQETEMSAEKPAPVAEQKMNYSSGGMEEAVLAGGCFWGVEAVFESLHGVQDVTSGYSGGEAETAEYRRVGTGTTGHAESVKIIYDPGQISYSTLLEVFFKVAHDPTQLNYQGPDRGTQYRSAIFYTSDAQKKTAMETIASLEKQNIYKEPIVTEVVPLEAFYQAESYHQDFIKLNPNNPYVKYWDIPKLEHLEKMYPALLASE